MQLLINLAVGFFAIWLGKRLFMYSRFLFLRNEYLARWSILSMEEKESILFAERGLWMRDGEEEIISDDRKYRNVGKTDENAELHRSLELDVNLDRLKEIVDGCPDYSTYDKPKLDLAFREMLDRDWWAMKASGDFAFTGTRKELDLMFERSNELAKEIKSKVQSRVSRKGTVERGQ